MFEDNTVQEAEEIRKELVRKKGETANALIDNVQRHYQQYAEVTKESAAVEADLSGLNGVFEEWRNALVAMKGVTFGFEERKRSHQTKERQKSQASQEKQVRERLSCLGCDKR